MHSQERGGSRRAKEETGKLDPCALSSFVQSGVGGGGTVKAMVDAHTPVSSQQRAAEEAAFLGLICNLDSLTASLRVVALL